MSTIRQPAVAGMFYPEAAPQLRAQLQQLLQQATPSQPCRAFIAPHAGYIYSGPIAANLYAALQPDSFQRVVVMGPSHRVRLQGIATSSADYFRTPLGDIPLDRTTITQLEQLPQVRCIDQAHAQEHSLEVHLPFLQQQLRQFTLIPLTVGDATANEIAEVIEQLWSDEQTLLVISSDLSHYHDYATATAMDRATSNAIEQLNGRAIGFEDACGRNPIIGMLTVAKRHNLQAKTIDLRNSGDTAGGKDRVVGYGAYIFTAANESGQTVTTTKSTSDALSPFQQQQLLAVAKMSIEHGLRHGKPLNPALQNYDSVLQQPRATFVTLEKNGQLRGCIGMLQASRPLITDVAENGFAAAFRDPRFTPLTAAELSEISLHISILTPAEPMQFHSQADLLQQIRPGVDGLILQDGNHRGTFLPSVWQQLPDKKQFLAHLKQKAGLSTDYWSDNIQISRYQTIMVE